MKKFLLRAIGFILLILALYLILQCKGTCPVNSNSAQPKTGFNIQFDCGIQLNNAYELLRARKDKFALEVFDAILAQDPENLGARWGKAEVLRRARQYQIAEMMLKEILKKDPRHPPSIISLAYIRYKNNDINEAFRLIGSVLKDSKLDDEDKALSYLMLGSINSRRATTGGLISKIKYGTHIKDYFVKACELAPQLPEVHLGLGTFYLKAPSIIGGNLEKAIMELGLAVRMAPDFATANARLAEAYKKNGDDLMFEAYLEKARKLDPDNEALKEILP